MNFYDIFSCSNAKVLDLVQIVGNMPVTISMVSDSVGLSYKTIQKSVRKFVKLGLMAETAKIGNAQGYQFQTKKLNKMMFIKRSF